MDTSVHISRALADAVVVESNIGVKKVVDCADVVLVLRPPLTELVRAEV